jgi:hypothetical protein
MLSLSIIVALEDPFVREAEKDDKMHSKLLRMTGDSKAALGGHGIIEQSNITNGGEPRKYRMSLFPDSLSQSHLPPHGLIFPHFCY